MFLLRSSRVNLSPLHCHLRLQLTTRNIYLVPLYGVPYVRRGPPAFLFLCVRGDLEVLVLVGLGYVETMVELQSDALGRV